MTIQIKNPKSIPSLSFNKIHIDNFILSIDRSEVGSGKKHVDMTSIPYAVSSDNGENIYGNNPETKRYASNDFDNDAMTYAIVSGENSTVEEAMGDFAAEKAKLVTEINSGTLSTWKLMAYFEAALGRIHEIANLAEMEKIE